MKRKKVKEKDDKQKIKPKVLSFEVKKIFFFSNIGGPNRALVFYNIDIFVLVQARPEEQATARTAANIVENFQIFPFNQLRLVKIVGISGIRQELNFINFLLANTPILERMTVKPASTDSGWDLVKELLRFRRASMFAEIVYLDP